MNTDGPILLSLHSIPFLIITLIILVILNIRTIFEPPYLVEILDALFIGMILLYIAYITAGKAWGSALRLVYFLARHQPEAGVELKADAGTEITFRFSYMHIVKGTS